MTEQRMSRPRTTSRNMLIGWTRIGSGWGARVGCLGGSIIERASTRTRRPRFGATVKASGMF